MTEKEKDRNEKRRRYFDVEKFQQVYLETQNKRGRLGKILGSVGWSLGSMQGLFIALLAFPLMFGTFLAVIVGVMYGPLAFLGLFGSIIGGLAFYADKKVGRSLQFGEYKFWTRTLAQVAAFGLALGLILLLLTWGSLRPF